MQDAGSGRRTTLETHLHSVKVKKRSFMQGMWDVAVTQLPKLQRCCDKESSSQKFWSLESELFGHFLSWDYLALVFPAGQGMQQIAQAACLGHP